MSDMSSFLKNVAQAQLFYAIVVTLVGYALAAGGISTVPAQLLMQPPTDLNEFNTRFAGGLEQQSQIPVLDIGPLIFYSGQLFIDLMVNFFTAVPSMVTMLLAGFFLFFPADAQIQFYAKLAFGLVALIVYVIGLIEFATNVRSGRSYS